MHARHLAHTYCPLALLSLTGCSMLVQPDESRLVRPDAIGTDATNTDGNSTDTQDVVYDSIRPDRATPCPGGCNDGVDCTVDQCNEATGQCTHMPDNSRCTGTALCDPTQGCVIRGCSSDTECDDRNVCNGQERCQGGHCVGGTPMRCDDRQMCNGIEICDPTRGCLPGTPPTCDDGNPCTQDRCNPSTSDGSGGCEHTPIDSDSDGYPARTVAGTTCDGTDCNDSNPTVHPGAPESCNGIDDDCNGRIDDGLSCPPPNDTCATAIPITLMGDSATVSGTTLGAANGVTSYCDDSRSPGGDVWYSLTYPASNDVRIEVSPVTDGTDPVLVIRSSCDGMNIACNDDVSTSSRGSRIWVRGEIAGVSTRRLFIVVDSYQRGTEGNFTLRVQTSPRVPPGTCSSPMFDVTEGGIVVATGPTGTGTTIGSCGGSGPTAVEEVYRFAGPAGTVRLAAYAPSVRPVLYARHSDCRSGRELGCSSGGALTRLDVMHPGGTSYFFVGGLGTAGTWYLFQVIAP